MPMFVELKKDKTTYLRVSFYPLVGLFTYWHTDSAQPQTVSSEMYYLSYLVANSFACDIDLCFLVDTESLNQMIPDKHDRALDLFRNPDIADISQNPLL